VGRNANDRIGSRAAFGWLASHGRSTFHCGRSMPRAHHWQLDPNFRTHTSGSRHGRFVPAPDSCTAANCVERMARQFIPRLSCRSFIANAARLQFHALAHSVHCIDRVRRSCVMRSNLTTGQVRFDNGKTSDFRRCPGCWLAYGLARRNGSGCPGSTNSADFRRNERSSGSCVDERDERKRTSAKASKED
jgi:hypothetical protein